MQLDSDRDLGMQAVGKQARSQSKDGTWVVVKSEVDNPICISSLGRTREYPFWYMNAVDVTLLLSQLNAQPKPSNPSNTAEPVQHLRALVKDVGKVAATAVLAILHGSHEDTGAAL